jgi:hypothetical protein
MMRGSGGRLFWVDFDEVFAGAPSAKSKTSAAGIAPIKSA